MSRWVYFRRLTRAEVREETRPCTSDGRQEVGSRWKHGHVPQTADKKWCQGENTAMYFGRQTRSSVKVETQPCTPGNGHVLQAMDMYIRRQTRGGVRIETQPCTPLLDGREQGQDRNSHVLQTTDERWGQDGNTATYFRRQTRAGVRMETRPCTSDDRREVVSEWKLSHIGQTTEESWGQGGNSHMLNARQTARLLKATLCEHVFSTLGVMFVSRGVRKTPDISDVVCCAPTG